MDYKDTPSNALVPMHSNNKDDSKSDVYSEERSSICLGCLYLALTRRFNRHCYNITIDCLFKYKRCYK
jgi:hypothetical protein